MAGDFNGPGERPAQSPLLNWGEIPPARERRALAAMPDGHLVRARQPAAVVTTRQDAEEETDDADPRIGL